VIIPLQPARLDSFAGGCTFYWTRTAMIIITRGMKRHFGPVVHVFCHDVMLLILTLIKKNLVQSK
jgi:hypothetical protein